jgi:hypothetical protein
MKKAAVFFLAFLFACAPYAGAAEKLSFPVKGKFYMQVDDGVGIWLNGEKIHHGRFGTSESKAVSLNLGDRIVMTLWNKGGPYGLKLLFVSDDRKLIINFAAAHFRVLRDPDKHDVTAKEFMNLRDSAQPLKKQHKDSIAFKNSAQWFWGEKKTGDTYVAGMVTKEMFSAFVP